MPACSSRRFILGALGAACASAALPALSAQAWPARPIRLVVPFPPGGATDQAARIIGEELSRQTGQPVLVDNKPGASTAIGVMSVSAAEPDGHTLLLSGSSSFTVNPAVRARLGYDPFRQLTPIAMVARVPTVWVTAGDGPIKSFPDFLAQARSRPGLLTYTTYGAGSAPHLTGEMLAHAVGVKLSPIPYKGSADAVIAILRGDVSTGIDTLTAVAPHLQSGKLRALAVASEKRSPMLPQVPAYGELQLSSALLSGWYAMAAPAGMAPALRDQILRAVTAVMASPQVRQKMALQSLEATLVGPAALREVMDEEITRYRAAVARAGMQMD